MARSASERLRSGARASTSRWVALVALLLAPWGLRLTLLAEMGSVGAVQAARGFGADFVLALIVWPMLLVARAWCGGLALAILLAWGVAHAANAEHVRILGALVGVDHLELLLDPVFVMGSVRSLARPDVIAFVLLSQWLIIRRGPSTPALDGSGRAYVTTGVVGVLALCAWPVDHLRAPWAQRSFVAAAFADTLLQPSGTVVTDTDGGHAILPSLAGDLRADLDAHLDGEPRVPLGQGGRNVLLVMLEGVGGGHLPMIAGDGAPATLRRLDQRVARDHLVYRRFVAQQRQTNRGQYALLCGDAPALVAKRPRMVAVATGEGRAPCLPSALAQAGYQTVYLQAAPLAFQRKDQFMPNAGFERVLGARSFDSDTERTPWGVGDGTLFERAHEVVTELEQQRQPWFLAVLTIGTHHPFHVPGAPTERDTTRAFARALEHADRVLDDFLGALETTGALDNTLVMITSDESSGLGVASPPAGDRALEALHQAWGLLTVRVPGVTAVVDEPFAQSDVALSVFDYLGLPTTGLPFGGRSVFRAYTTPRPIAFGNAYLKLVGAIFGDDYYLCDATASECDAWRLDGGFGRLGRGARPTDPVREAWIRGVATTPSRLGRSARARDTRWWGPLFAQAALVGAEDEPVRLETRFQWAQGSRVEVTMEAIYEGPGMALRHELQWATDARRQLDLPALIDGDRVMLRYTVRTGMASWPDVVIRLNASGAGTLTFWRAGVHLTPDPTGARVDFETGAATVQLVRSGQRLEVALPWRDVGALGDH